MLQHWLAVLVILAASGIAAPYAAGQSLSIHDATLGEANARTQEINTQQLRQILADNSALLVDTRSSAEYEAGHIPGAIQFDAPPGKEVEAASHLVGGDKTKGMVLYCNGPFCQASRRIGEQLANAGFTNVRRYQLGIPVWRALGGPTAIGLDGIKRIFKADQTVVFFDARAANEFAQGSLPGARSAPADDVMSGRLKKMDLPEDDFNRRIVLFGRDAAQARQLADFMSKRPWHNVMYFPGDYTELSQALASTR
jgi:rhodanese-related sulfurtransferase